MTPAELPAQPSCAGCHGSEASIAPPSALGGIDDPSYLGVGAHQVHLAGGPNTKPVACAECHPTPDAIDAPGHIDTPWPAEVQWGSIATTRGSATPWDREEATCTVWCHGTDAPTWVDGSAACGTCHSLPPAAPHPASSSCGDCHPPSSQQTHVDGVVQLLGDTPTGDTGGTATEGCDGCHGQAGNANPPPDTSGNVESTFTTVGAHAAHIGAGRVSDGIACSDCHVVPLSVGDAGHIDASPAEVPFGGISLNGGATPSWNGTSCTNTYCHAGPGAREPEPAWTEQSPDRSCQACHGAPPPPPHPVDSACGNCHSSVAGPSFSIIDPTQHVNGTLNF